MRNSAYPYYFLSIFQSMDKCRNCGVVGEEGKKNEKNNYFFDFLKRVQVTLCARLFP